MRNLLAAGAILLMMASCAQAPKQENAEAAAPEEQQTEKQTWIAENVPAAGLDVNSYSTGFQHVGLPTADVEKTIEFYKGLGFELAMRRDVDGKDFAFLKLGTLLIEVIPNENPSMEAGAVDHFCLDVKNIDELYAKLKEAGYTMMSENVNDIAFWDNGAKYFFILGPNNEKIEFCEVL